MIDHVVRCLLKKKKVSISLWFVKRKERKHFTLFFICHFTNVMSKSINVSTKFNNWREIEILIFILQLCNRPFCKGEEEAARASEEQTDVQTASCVNDSAMIKVLQYEQFFKIYFLLCVGKVNLVALLCFLCSTSAWHKLSVLRSRPSSAGDSGWLLTSRLNC